MRVSGPRNQTKGPKTDRRLSPKLCLKIALIYGRRVRASNPDVTNILCEVDADSTIEAFLTNATSLYFVTAAFLPLLAKSISSPTGKIGSVVNTTSNSGLLRM
jgi:hypothetical protein